MEKNHICKKCGGIAGWDTYFQSWICTRCGNMEPKHITNYDRTISMTPEELAKFMGELPCCPPGADVKELCYPMDACEGTDLQVQCWLDWLRKEVEE